MGIFDATPLALTTTILQEMNLIGMIIGAIIYSFTVLSIHSLRRNNLNLLTINVCLSTITYSIYWSLFVMLTFLPNYFQLINQGNICLILLYFQIVVNSQVIYSYVIVSINRMISVIYYRQSFFKSFKWTTICIMIQWVMGFLLPLPQLYQNRLVCRGGDRGMFINSYTLITLVLCPLIILCSSNLSVFILAVKSRSRTINPIRIEIPTTHATQGQVPPHTLFSNSTIPFEVNQDQQRRRHPANFERVSKRDMKILSNIGIMLGIYLLGWIPIYLLPISVPSAISTGSPLLFILGSFPSCSLFLNLILLYRYNQPLRQHMIIILTNKYRRLFQ